MATQTIQFRADAGLTLKARLYPVASDTAFAAEATCTEATNRKGLYSFTQSASSGKYEVKIWDDTGTRYLLGTVFVKTTDTAATFECVDQRIDLEIAEDAETAAAGGGGGGGGGETTSFSHAALDQLRGVRFIGPASVSSSPRQIVAGDDYSGSRVLRFESDALPDLSGASSITFTMRTTNRANTVALTTTTVAYAEDPARLEVTLASAQTRIDPGWYDADIEAVVDSKKQTVVGPKVRFEVLEDQTR